MRNVDALAALRARTTGLGSEPLDPMTHVGVRQAIGFGVHAEWLFDVGRFARWVARALRPASRRRTAPVLEEVRKEVRFAAPTIDSVLQAYGADRAQVCSLHDLVTSDGVRSARFRTAAEEFLRRWACRPRELVHGPSGHHRRDYFRRTVIYYLAAHLAGPKDGPTTFALLFAAIGTDAPIAVRPGDDDAAAIERRTCNYKKEWVQRVRRAGAAAPRRYLILPVEPERPTRDRHGHMRSGRLRPPFLRGHAGAFLVHRPRDVPHDARIVADGHAIRACWSVGRRRRTVVLARVKQSPTATGFGFVPID